MNYKITRAISVAKLEDEVQKLWDQGYRPHGSMQIVGNMLMQPMVKETINIKG